VLLRVAPSASIAKVSAHANAANVMVGPSETLCSFDYGTPEQRADRVAGAGAAISRPEHRAIGSRT
jgi:hypothetical protein